MAEPTITADFDDLRREIGRYLGYGRASGSWSADEIQDILDILKSAQRRVYFPIDPRNGRGYKWSWLMKEDELTTEAPWTGDSNTVATVTISSGTCTLDDTVTHAWPSWAASGELLVGGVSYTVASRTNDDEIVLDDTSDAADVTAGTFKLGQHRYQLPDDFLALDSPLTYQPGSGGWWPSVEIRNESDIRQARQSHELFSHPIMIAVVPRPFVGATGQRFDALLGPTPDARYVLQYRYIRVPDTIDATHKYQPGGPSLSELMLSACLAESEAKLNNAANQYYEQRFQRAMAAAIQQDRISHTPMMHGYVGNPYESYSDASEVYRVYTLGSISL